MTVVKERESSTETWRQREDAAIHGEDGEESHDQINVEENKEDEDELVYCKDEQLYQCGSAQGVECIVCHAQDTSGSWRKGWPVRDGNGHANLCNRCGQRWAKLGKTTSTDVIRNVIKRNASSSGISGERCHKRKNPLSFGNELHIHEGGLGLSPRLNSPFDMNSPTFSPFPSPTPGQYVGYTMQKVTDGKITYALFWLMDYQEDYLLVALGVDNRSSGHFTYQQAPSLPPTVQPLKCTNRSQTLTWMEANFGVRKQLPSSVANRMPKIGIPQIEMMIAQQKSSRIHAPILQEEKQYLCASCGGNHPSEHCTEHCISPAFLDDITIPSLDDVKDTMLPDLAMTDKLSIFPDELLPLDALHPKDEDESPQDTLFMTSSPMEYVNDAVCAPTKTATLHPTAGSTVLNSHTVHQKIDTVLAKDTHASGVHGAVDWTSTIPSNLVEQVYTSWTRSISTFCNQDGTNGHNDGSHIVTILDQLLRCNDINLELIERSQMSKSVALLCRHHDSTIAGRAKELVGKWRSCAFAALNVSSTYHQE